MGNSSTSVLLRLTLAASIAMAPVTVAVAQQERQGSPQQNQQQTEPQGNQQQGDRSNQGNPDRTAGLTVPVNGTVSPEGNPQATTPLAGTFTIQRFVRDGSQINAVGTLTTTFTNPATQQARTLVTQATLPLVRQASGGQASAPAPAEQADMPDSGPAADAQQVCDVLHLTLGPLDLDLLGLRVHLNQGVLDVTAVPGAGNLLGNLTCAITGLLDGTGQVAPRRSSERAARSSCLTSATADVRGRHVAPAVRSSSVPPLFDYSTAVPFPSRVIA